MKKRITRDQIQDAANALAGKWVLEAEAAAEKAPDTEPSEAFQRRMAFLLEDSRRAGDNQRKKRSLVWIVAPAALTVIIAIIGLVSVTIQRDGENVFWKGSSVGTRDFPSYRLGWVPEGGEVKWEVSNPQKRHYSIVIIFHGTDELRFDYGISSAETTSSLSGRKETLIPDDVAAPDESVEAYHGLKGNDYEYFWISEEEGLSFLLYSTLDPETNRKILEQIRLIPR